MKFFDSEVGKNEKREIWSGNDATGQRVRLKWENVCGVGLGLLDLFKLPGWAGSVCPAQCDK